MDVQTQPISVDDSRAAGVLGRYLLALTAIVLGILTAIFLINFVADPYGMRGVPGSRILPLDSTFEREIRYNLITAKRPSTLFLGASQVSIGIDPGDPAIPDRNAFNAAPDGGSLREDIRLLRHAEEFGTLRQVVLGVSYNMTTHEDQDAFNDLFLGDSGGLLQHIEAFLSATMLHSSVKVALDRLTRHPLEMDASGRLTRAFMEAHTRMHGGTRAAFDAISRPSIPNVDGFMRELAEFSEIVCRAHSALTIMLVPDHAIDLELFAVSGQWNVLKQWKKDIVALAADARCRASVIDFEDYNFVSTEKLPPRGSDSEMRYYWDSGHFKAEAGSLMLARIFEGPRAPALHGQSFGTELNEHSVIQSLQRLDDGRARYEREHRMESSYVAEMVRQTGLPASATR